MTDYVNDLDQSLQSMRSSRAACASMEGDANELKELKEQKKVDEIAEFGLGGENVKKSFQKPQLVLFLTPWHHPRIKADANRAVIEVRNQIELLTLESETGQRKVLSIEKLPFDALFDETTRISKLASDTHLLHRCREALEGKSSNFISLECSAARKDLSFGTRRDPGLAFVVLSELLRRIRSYGAHSDDAIAPLLKVPHDCNPYNSSANLRNHFVVQISVFAVVKNCVYELCLEEMNVVPRQRNLVNVPGIGWAVGEVYSLSTRQHSSKSGFESVNSTDGLSPLTVQSLESGVDFLAKAALVLRKMPTAEVFIDFSVEKILLRVSDTGSRDLHHFTVSKDRDLIPLGKTLGRVSLISLRSVEETMLDDAPRVAIDSYFAIAFFKSIIKRSESGQSTCPTSFSSVSKLLSRRSCGGWDDITQISSAITILCQVPAARIFSSWHRTLFQFAKDLSRGKEIEVATAFFRNPRNLDSEWGRILGNSQKKKKVLENEDEISSAESYLFAHGVWDSGDVSYDLLSHNRDALLVRLLTEKLQELGDVTTRRSSSDRHLVHPPSNLSSEAKLTNFLIRESLEALIPIGSIPHIRKDVSSLSLEDFGRLEEFEAIWYLRTRIEEIMKKTEQRREKQRGISPGGTSNVEELFLQSLRNIVNDDTTPKNIVTLAEGVELKLGRAEGHMISPRSLSEDSHDLRIDKNRKKEDSHDLRIDKNRKKEKKNNKRRSSSSSSSCDDRSFRGSSSSAGLDRRQVPPRPRRPGKDFKRQRPMCPIEGVGKVSLRVATPHSMQKDELFNVLPTSSESGGPSVWSEAHRKGMKGWNISFDGGVGPLD